MEQFKKIIHSRNFQETYWGKRAKLFKSAIDRDFGDFGSEDLITMAHNEYYHCQLITHAQKWQVDMPPISFDFKRPDKKYTLLVHNLDKYFLSIKELFHLFEGYPRWCLEDVMGSYSNQDAISPAHVDSYDVFLIQIDGKRTWHLEYNPDVQYQPDLPLRILKKFQPSEEYLMEPGDILYIPHGVAHQGETHTDTLSLSVGFSAFNLAQLTQNLVLDSSKEEFYHPQPRQEIHLSLQTQKEMYQQLLDGIPSFQKFQQALLHSQAWLPDELPVEVDLKAFPSLLQQGKIFRDELISLVMLETNQNTFKFQLAGETFELNPTEAEVLTKTFQAPLNSPVEYSESKNLMEIYTRCYQNNIFFEDSD